MKNNVESIKKYLAANTKTLRKKRGLSQEDFADQCGIDRTYASQIERAIANPSLEVLSHIANTLEVSIEDLLSQHDEG